METIGIVFNVGVDQVAEFEQGFREMEAPIWRDLHARGVLNGAHPHAPRRQHGSA